ncbi:MAG: glycosyltransferase family 39 protein [Anaerolineae bacterium]|nr:glycosyltransferase family 39 protein [Anaerolineae bacterium]
MLRRDLAGTPRTANRIALYTSIVLVVLAAIPIGWTIWTYRDYPFDSDEAVHANTGLELALDLRAGDLSAFVRDAYRQGFYPPAFSVLKAVLFLLLGPSTLTARLFSLACLCVAMVVVYQVGQVIDEHHGWLIGLIAVALTLTSQPLLVASGLAMMETPGLLASFGMLWLYLKALESPTAGRLVGTSLALLATFLTKYTYGLPAAATVVLMECSSLLPWWRGGMHYGGEQGLPEWSRALIRRWLLLFGPFALALVLWFAGPDKLAMFWAYVMTQPDQQAWHLETLLFYPRSIAFHYTPSPLFALVTLCGIVWATTRLRQPRLRLLLIYFCAGMGEMFLNSQKETRFIATFVPAAHVLTGAMLAWCADHWRRGTLSRWWGLVALLLAVSIILAVPVLADRFRTYPSLMEVEYETHPALNDLAAWIREQIPSGERFYLINFWDQFSPSALAWYLGTRDVPPGTRLAEVYMPSTLLKSPSEDNIAALRGAILASGVRYVVSFEGTPWGEPVWWLYADAMDDILDPVAQRVTYVELYDTGEWLNRSLLRQREWEHVKGKGRYTLQVQTTVYAVMTSAQKVE